MISRRSFLSLPLLALDIKQSQEFRFQYDHVIGTSLDLVIWTSHPAHADLAANLVLNEIDRLTAILSTYDPSSEISRHDRLGIPVQSPELAEMLQTYDRWEKRTGGVLSSRPLGPGTPLNVDALGKAYIIDRAAAAAWKAAPDLDGLLLNIGGDIVVRGMACDVAIANPDSPHDNADPLTHVVLRNMAIATSGTYARGAHLLDARTGQPSPTRTAATVIARDAVTANALATTLCIVNADEAMNLVERTAAAEALLIERTGNTHRSTGFARMELVRSVRQTAPTNWPTGFELTIAVTLTNPDPRLDRPYLAAWVEDPAGKLVRAIVFWGSKSRYYSELSSFWTITGGDPDLFYKVTRATRPPGSHKIVWNGLDNDGKPVPRGTYRIVIETHRYHGSYAKGSAMISCNSQPESARISSTVNFDAIAIQYGPRPTPA